VTLLFVLLQHSAGRYFLGTPAISAALFGGFLDVFVLPLLFRPNTSQVFFPWHICGSSNPAAPRRH
jgi:hypothetical protein